jgi:predicted nucleic acid-binding protein
VNSLYVDTTALARVLLKQPDAPVIKQALARSNRRVANRLLGVELRRVARREALGDAAEELLDDIALVPLDQTLLGVAETVEPYTVASLDAIHLATAVQLLAGGDLDAILTYDLRLAEGARHHGIAVVSPT